MRQDTEPSSAGDSHQIHQADMSAWQEHIS